MLSTWEMASSLHISIYNFSAAELKILDKAL